MTKTNDVIGKFITLEGGEGVGKTTLIKSVGAWLESMGKRVVMTREPGGTALGDGIRQLFKSPPEGEVISAEAEALLVSAARAQHVTQVIRPALARGEWVLCDRFADSMRVYQGLLNGVALNDVEWLIQFSTGGVLPDITFLLDCDVDTSLRRISEASLSRDDATRFDHAERHVHERLRGSYRKVAGFFPGRFYILEGGQPPQQVFESARLELSRRWLNA